MRNLVFIAVILLAISSCRKGYDGELAENQAPETQMVADTVIRFADNRFKSVIDVEWWGDDPDGFITGYEISLDGIIWTFTSSQDSTLTLILPNNADTANFRIYVRAIDNDGLVDPSPASLVYPVKNSAPDVSFIIGARTPQRTFPAMKYFWNGTDPDGDASIDHYELVWNDTTSQALEISASFQEAAIVGEDLSGSSTACEVYPGNLNNALTDKLQGLRLNADNVLYIRAVDAVGTPSAWISSPIVYVRKPASDILFINAQQSSFNRSTYQNFYTNKIFNTLNRTFDTLQAGPDNAANTDLSIDPQTQDRVFSFFTRIFVYSENSEYVMSLLQRSSTGFFSKGGKMVLITEGNDVIEDQPSYLDFSPIASYTERPNNVSLLLNLNDSIYSGLPGYASLTNSSSILSGIRPFEIPGNNSNFTYESLYDAVITQDSSGQISLWQGNSTVIASRARAQTGEADFVISLLPIHRLDDVAAMDNWFDRILNDLLKF